MNHVVKTSDLVYVVRCRECIHAPSNLGEDVPAMDIDFPDDWCPYHVCDEWYNEMPQPDWFCYLGERRQEI